MRAGRNIHGPMSDKFIVVSRKIRSKEVVDSRNGLRCGTLATLFSQYGLQVERKGGDLWLCAPVDQLQMFLERLHFGGIPYVIRKA